LSREADRDADSCPSGDSDCMEHMRDYQGLLLDFGGVVTTDFFASLGAHCERLGLPHDRFRDLVTADPIGRALYHQVERGELSQSEFERKIARLLGVEPRGLVQGLLADLRPDPQMTEAVVHARAAGIRTGVISNSWGTTPFDPYAAYKLDEQFDAVVISSDVGIRKPDPAIYLLAADKLGVAPEACVFVDDIASNLRPAQEVGMAVVHHVEPARTIRELERLFRLVLRGGDTEHLAQPDG
jgi:putative hydrolase of the HAD superfamily